MLLFPEGHVAVFAGSEDEYLAAVEQWISEGDDPDRFIFIGSTDDADRFTLSHEVRLVGSWISHPVLDYAIASNLAWNAA
ncbi:MAG TPA: hypothetical protein VM328_12775 [Fimbriimonadaceae bacterium]|nr:hypothetical protein [Fimbriimonadaceae bacterium]